MKNKKLISKMGYRDDSPYRDRSHIDIHTPDGSIDMSQTGIPLWANGRILPPYSGTHQFDTNVVREIPLAQGGGSRKAPSRKGVRLNYDEEGNVIGESSHIMKTETLDGLHWFSFPTLFQNEDGSWLDMSEESDKDWKPAMLEAKKRGELIHFGADKEEALAFGEGSWKDLEYEELELTDEEIEEYKKGGYVVEELPKAQKGIGSKVTIGDKVYDTTSNEYRKLIESGNVKPYTTDTESGVGAFDYGNLPDFEVEAEASVMSKDRANRIYNAIAPTGYTDLGNIQNFSKIDDGSYIPERTDLIDPRSEEMYRQYLGINDEPTNLSLSTTRPSISNDPDATYYKLDPKFEESVVRATRDLGVGEQRVLNEINDMPPEFYDYDDNYGGYNIWSGLGDFTVSKKIDPDTGKEYVSYYDKYDFPETIQGGLKGKPYEVYNRINPADYRQLQGKEIEEASKFEEKFGEGTYLPTYNAQNFDPKGNRFIDQMRWYDETMKLDSLPQIEKQKLGGELPVAQTGGRGKDRKAKYLRGQRKQNKRYGWKRDKKRSKNEKIDEVEEVIEETPIINEEPLIYPSGEYDNVRGIYLKNLRETDQKIKERELGLNELGTSGDEWYNNLVPHQQLDLPFEMFTKYSDNEISKNYYKDDYSKKELTPMQQFAIAMKTKGKQRPNTINLNTFKKLDQDEIDNLSDEEYGNYQRDLEDYDKLLTGYNDQVELFDHPYFRQTANKFWDSEEVADRNIEGMKHRMYNTDADIGNKSESFQMSGNYGYMKPEYLKDNYRTGFINIDEGIPREQKTIRHELIHSGTVAPNITGGGWKKYDQTLDYSYLLPEFNEVNKIPFRSNIDDWQAWDGSKSYPLNYNDEEEIYTKKPQSKYYDHHSTYVTQPAEFLSRKWSVVLPSMIKDDFNWNEKSGEEIIDYLQKKYNETGHQEYSNMLNYNNLQGDPYVDYTNVINESKERIKTYNDLSKRKRKKYFEELSHFDKQQFNEDVTTDLDPIHRIMKERKLVETDYSGNYIPYNDLDEYDKEKYDKNRKQVIENLKENEDGKYEYKLPGIDNSMKFTPDPKFIEKIFKETVQEPTIPDAGQLPTAQEGGEYMDLDLTEDQIKNFKDGGFVVEDLPKAQIAEYGSYLYDNGGPTDPPRKYEEGIRYVDPNNTGLLNLKFTPKGGAYEEIDGKYYRYKFTTDKDKINYDPTEGIDWNPDYTLDGSGSMSVEDKEKYDNRYANQMYAGEEERINSLAEDGFDASGNYADWRAKGFSSADEYYNYLQTGVKPTELAGMALKGAGIAADELFINPVKRIASDPIGTLGSIGNTTADVVSFFNPWSYGSAEPLMQYMGESLVGDDFELPPFGYQTDGTNVFGTPYWTDNQLALDATVVLPSLKFIGKGASSTFKVLKKMPNKIATGNSIIPYAWKPGLEGTKGFKAFDEFAGANLSAADAKIIEHYMHKPDDFIIGTPGKKLLDDVIARNPSLSQGINSPITRIDGYYQSAEFRNKDLSYGDVVTFDRPRSFTVGEGHYGGASDKTRFIIPKRYAKNMGKDFFKVPYKESINLRKSVGSRWDKMKKKLIGNNILNLYKEKEIIGMPKLKVIGTNNSGNYKDVIVKPIGSSGGSGVKSFGSYLQNNATNTYNKAIGFFNDYYMTAIPQAGVQSAYVKNLFNRNNLNINTFQQLRNDGRLIEPIIYDNSLISSPLPIDKVPYISKRITPLSQEERIYNSFIPGMNESKITNFNRAGDVIDESGNIINQTYIKSFKDRTHPVRGGKTFSDGVAEYNSLKSMHDLYPDKFVKPIRVTVNKKGEATGYMMEKVNGVTLDKWLKDNKMSQLMYEDIKSTIQGLHRKGIYHGDLKANNIIVNEWGNWKIIDPVGFKHSNQMTDKMLKEAKKLDSESINSIRKLYENQN